MKKSIITRYGLPFGVYTKGTTVTVILLGEGKKAIGVSHCAPIDKYDFKVGLKIALYRCLRMAKGNDITELKKEMKATENFWDTKINNLKQKIPENMISFDRDQPLDKELDNGL